MNKNYPHEALMLELNVSLKDLPKDLRADVVSFNKEFGHLAPNSNSKSGQEILKASKALESEISEYLDDNDFSDDLDPAEIMQELMGNADSKEVSLKRLKKLGYSKNIPVARFIREGDYKLSRLNIFSDKILIKRNGSK